MEFSTPILGLDKELLYVRIGLILELEEALNDEVGETVFGITLLECHSLLGSLLQGELLCKVELFRALLFFGPEIHKFLG